MRGFRIWQSILLKKYLQQVDELFKNESKRSLVTNQTSFDGANSVRIYKVGTAAMNDYDRAGVTAGSRYGKPETLTAVTETYALPEDRSFSFVTTGWTWTRPVPC